MRAFGPRRRAAPPGFTLVELIIALALGAVVLATAVGFVIREMRRVAGSEIRDSLNRNGRYIGVSLRHDVQRAGIDIVATESFGSVAVWPGTYGDTLVVFFVPYLPTPAPSHPLVPPPGNDNPLPPGGTCGSRCIEVVKDSLAPLELAPGDLVRLEVPGVRHLALIQEIDVASDTSVELTFTEAPVILRQPAGFSGGLRLDRFASFVQEVAAVVYFVDAEGQLQRAQQLELNGAPRGDVLAYGVEQFDAKLIFIDGDELEVANAVDVDNTNDYDDIVAARVLVGVRADRPDPRVKGGELLRRQYEWTIAPRNLRYEKSRI